MFEQSVGWISNLVQMKLILRFAFRNSPKLHHRPFLKAFQYDNMYKKTSRKRTPQKKENKGLSNLVSQYITNPPQKTKKTRPCHRVLRPFPFRPLSLRAAAASAILLRLRGQKEKPKPWTRGVWTDFITKNMAFMPKLF